MLVFERGLHRFRAEIAPQILVVVQEVVSPDLHDSSTVLRPVPRVDGPDACVIIVTERLTVRRVGKVARQGDHERHDLRGRDGSIVIALQAPSVLSNYLFISLS